MEFEWDEDKAAGNVVKHGGVSFMLGARTFADPNRVVIDAIRQVDGETRLKCVGLVEGRLLIAVFTLRRRIYRIISARRANKQEEKAYHGNR